MRSWVAIGNDLLSAIDIKEGMKYAGGIKNTKVAVVEIVLRRRYVSLDGRKLYVFMIFCRSYRKNKRAKCFYTSLSIRYGSDNMNIFKASGIGTGLTVPYKQLDFETNMRIINPFRCSINEQESNTVPKQ